VAQKIEKDKYGIIISNNPRKDFFELHNKLVKEDFYFTKRDNQISEKAYISEKANIGKYNIIIEDNIIIEAGVTIYENVTIRRGTTIKSGTILGADGFQYVRDREEIIKVEPAGELEIAENVVIHNNSVIDKGIFGKTFIGENTKIYNLVHVAHDSKIGKNVFLTAGVIVCGRVKIGDNSYLGPNCTIKNGLFLDKNSKVSMGAVVTKNVKDNEVVTGNFAIPHEQFIKNLKKI
jgi:UDP-3-O-(R-3-hydroxymyristoyl)-glucosamine N-acyltransferase